LIATEFLSRDSERQRWREYEEMVDWVTLQVRQARRDLNKVAERYRVQSESLELAQKRQLQITVLRRVSKAILISLCWFIG
jgi:DNA repair ATPase RecN